MVVADETNNCDCCTRTLAAGERQTALVLSKDEILINGDVQPISADQVKIWCEKCAEDEMVKLCEALALTDQRCAEGDVFAYCDCCQKPLCYGSTMLSLIGSEEQIFRKMCIPTSVEYLSCWCEACEPETKERLIQNGLSVC